MLTKSSSVNPANLVNIFATISEIFLEGYFFLARPVLLLVGVGHCVFYRAGLAALHCAAETLRQWLL